MRILHLSDTHLLGDGGLHHGTVDTLAALRRVLGAIEADAPIDVVVASGDLSDDGSVRSYELLRDVVGGWAEARSARVVYAMGNHDARASFASVLGGDAAAPLDSVHLIDGVRVIVLDSTVPGAGYGVLRRAQLDNLRGVLAERGPADGTLLVLHHPPVPASTVLLQALALQNADELLDALAGSDVRVVLAGHYHHALATTARGIPILVAPAIANTADVLAPHGTERAHVGSGATIVDLPDSGGVRATAVHVSGPDDGRVVYFLDRDAVARVAREAGPDARLAGHGDAAARPPS